MGVPQPQDVAGILFPGNQAIPPGAEDRLRDVVFMAGQDRQQVAVGRVPQPDRAVAAARGGKPPTIGAERHMRDRRLVAAQRRGLPCRSHCPRRERFDPPRPPPDASRRG